MHNARTVSTRAISLGVWRRVAAVGAGVLLVALGAQAAVPLPGTPVPLTFQVPAVLVVGGLLGPRLAAASLVTYLAIGAAGIPVFAPVGLPGLARLLGPTGGYLLAFPVAAVAVGQIAARQSWANVVGGALIGVIIIHLGGVAHLAALGGDVGAALRLGSLPFLAGDAVKVLLASVIIRRLGGAVRDLL